MIHWTPEGYKCKQGLNVYFTKKWFRLIWVFVNLADYKVTGYYFRVRYNLQPHFIFDRITYNLFEQYLFDTDQYVITREQYLEVKDKLDES